jgi:hypothetical protein
VRETAGDDVGRDLACALDAKIRLMRYKVFPPAAIVAGGLAEIMR